MLSKCNFVSLFEKLDRCKYSIVTTDTGMLTRRQKAVRSSWQHYLVTTPNKQNMHIIVNKPTMSTNVSHLAYSFKISWHVAQNNYVDLPIGPTTERSTTCDKFRFVWFKDSVKYKTNEWMSILLKLYIANAKQRCKRFCVFYCDSWPESVCLSVTNRAC